MARYTDDASFAMLVRPQINCFADKFSLAQLSCYPVLLIIKNMN